MLCFIRSPTQFMYWKPGTFQCINKERNLSLRDKERGKEIVVALLVPRLIWFQHTYFNKKGEKH